jgi:hypothetical protein
MSDCAAPAFPTNDRKTRCLARGDDDTEVPKNTFNQTGGCGTKPDAPLVLPPALPQANAANHQRRQLVPAPQHKPDAGCALDRDAPRLKFGDIPVDGTHRDLQLAGDRGCGHRLRSGAQDAGAVDGAKRLLFEELNINRFVDSTADRDSAAAFPAPWRRRYDATAN